MNEPAFLNYHHLRYFWAVAREGSLRQASEKLRVSQPSMSTQISLLAEALGGDLFRPRGRSVELTEFGQMIYGYAEEIFALGGEILGSSKQAPGVRSLRLHVGIVDSFPKLMSYDILRPVFEHEEGVRKFVAYDEEQRVAGFAFYDPMYRGGEVYGYSANIVRCDEARFGRLATALHMEAMEAFKPEGKEVLNLLLAPFVKLDGGRFNEDWGARLFFRLSARFGNSIYNFNGLSFHKSKYRGMERSLYFASNSLLPSGDVYLAFASAGLTDGCVGTLRKLVGGMLGSGRNGKGG